MNKPPAAGKGPPERFAYRRTALKDALVMQGLVMECANKNKASALALSSLARALCSLIPLVRALQGRTLFLSGVTSRKADPSPADVLKQLKNARKNGHILDVATLISDEPTTPKPAEAEPSKPKDKGIS